MSPAKLSHRRYTIDDIYKAARDVQSGNISVRKAALTHNIPYTTLKDKLTGQSPLVVTRMGPAPLVSDENEETLCKYIRYMHDNGAKITHKSIRMLVKHILRAQQENGVANARLKDENYLGKTWVKLFLKRHSDLPCRKPLPEPRPRTLTEEDVENWFEKAHNHFINNNQTEPSRGLAEARQPSAHKSGPTGQLHTPEASSTNNATFSGAGCSAAEPVVNWTDDMDDGGGESDWTSLPLMTVGPPTSKSSNEAIYLVDDPIELSIKSEDLNTTDNSSTATPSNPRESTPNAILGHNNQESSVSAFTPCASTSISSTPNISAVSSLTTSGIPSILEVIGAMTVIRRFCEAKNIDLTLLQQLEMSIAKRELEAMSSQTA